MSETKFTDEQIAAWVRYEEVRQSNRFNMWAPQAARAARLSEEEHLFCIENYSALKVVAQGVPS